MTQKLKQLIGSAVNSGHIGGNCSFVDLVHSDERGEDHFASDVVFADIKVVDGNSHAVTIPVTIKRQRDDEYHRREMNTDGQFYNEVLMYEEIIPFLEQGGVTDIFPKYIFGRATLGNFEEDILAIDNLKRQGFVPAKERLFLDFDHCALALKKVAQFHALSYTKKQNNLDDLLAKTAKLKNVHWTEQDQITKDKNNRFLRVSIERGISPLLKEGVCESALKKLRKVLQDPLQHMMDWSRPDEPWAVVCHGDFCRNNMLFRYDQTTGCPVDVRLIDVATAKYSSPAIDLSFFLLMNTTAELRDTRWNDLLQVYHATLSSSCPGCPVPSIETIRQELNQKMGYGYVICSFFLPMMMEVKSLDDAESWVDKTEEELEEISRNRGGELGTKYISDVARHIVKLTSPKVSKV